MKKKTFLLVFFVMMAAGFGLFYFFRLKLYPAAIVNGAWVGARELERRSHAAAQYYDKALLTYKLEDGTTPPRDAVEREIRRAVLDKLIENIIVSEELRTRLGEEEARAAVERKVNGASFKTDEVASAVKELYGFTLDEFRDIILVPQAERELLEDQFSNAEEGAFTKWLDGVREAAKVTMFAHLFRWNNGQVELKAAQKE